MKKIIYSLVIMIAAGSLFTSCIQQVEPEGIKALREAKARYYDALSQLRGKDGLLREAEAALKNAEAALKQAEAAHQQAVTDAYTKMQALERELKELEIAEKTMEMELRAAEIEAEIDAIQKEMELADKQHEIDLINKQAEKAQAEENLRVVLRDIALQAQDLTAAEKEAVLGAAEAYLEIWEAVQDQKIVVMKKQYYLDSLKIAVTLPKNQSSDYVWDKESHAYQAKIDNWNAKIERAEGFIAEDEQALENIPAYADVEKWAEELAGYKAKETEWEYKEHQVKQDIAYYYVANVHDGVKTFNDAIDEWKNDPANKVVAEPTEPTKPEESKYKINNTTDSLKLTSITVTDKDADKFVIYKRFGDLVGELDDLPVPNVAGFKDKTGKVAVVEKEGSNYTVTVNATTAMKNLIFGNTEGNTTTYKYKWLDGDTEKDITATTKYGLDGAVSVLERELVLAEEALDVEALEKAYKDAEKKWKEDRAVLEAGLAKYQPYLDALKAYNDLKNAESANGDKMVKAVDALMEALNSVNAADLSKNDSVRIADAIAAYAQAREDYFDYAWDPEGTDKFDRKFYWYGNGIGDTLNIAFREVSYAKLADKNAKFGKTVAAPQNDFKTKNTTIAHMMYQLVNTTFGNEIGDNDAPWSFSLADINDDNCKAFYTLYKYVPEVGDVPAHFVLNDGMDTPYTSAALTAAKDAVNKAIAAYMTIYNNYWYGQDYKTACGNLNESSTAKQIAAARDKEIKVGIYTENTFCDPYEIASVLSDGSVIYNDGLGTILAFIDPKVIKANAWDYNNGSNKLIDNTIFGKAGSLTTFAKYLQAKQAFENHGALLAYKEALEEIKAWVETLRGEFDAAIAANGTTDTAAYNTAVNKYNEDKEAYDEDKAKYDAYMTALKKFVGVDEDDKPLVTDPATLKIADSYRDAINAVDVKFPLVDVVKGDWIETLGGDLLELANKCFPDFPTELEGWQARYDEINDQASHNKLLISYLNPVYANAAKIINHDEYPVWKRNADGEIDVTEMTDIYNGDFITLVENYKKAIKAYENAIKADIKAQEEAIDTNMKNIADFQSGIAYLDILVAEAESELEIEQKKLNAMEEVLKGARENLERIFQYLETLDVNFVIIPTDGKTDPII